MRFIRLIDARFHAFYQKHWPEQRPGFYSYLVVSVLLAMNGLSIYIARDVVLGNTERVSKTVPIGIYLCALAIAYAVIYAKGERERAIQEYAQHRRKWNTIAVIYALGSLALMLTLAYLARRNRGF